MAAIASGKKADPSVSVVMPTFNRAELIVESIQSVIAQTYRDWELLVVDDGSTDDTIERIDALGDPRIRVLKQARIGNSAKLRNIGVEAARGDYVAFLDSDDLWDPSKLEIQIEALSSEEGAWCYTEHHLVDARGTPMPLRSGRFTPASGRIARQLMADETGASIITCVAPRMLLRQLGGFDESLVLRDDLDLMLRLAEAADAIAINQVLAFAREHGGRKTKAISDQHRRTAVVFEKAAARSRDPSLKRLATRRRAEHFASAGESVIAEGRFAAGGRLLCKSLGHGAVRALAKGLWRRMRK